MSQPEEEQEYCETYWGSHGCDLQRRHTGNHQCLDSNGSACHEINPTGADTNGYEWNIYGDDTPCDACGKPGRDPSPLCPLPHP